MKTISEKFEIKSLAWHKKQAEKSESWSRRVCVELGITPEDLRLLVDQKRAH